jgi:hypothetical protein
MNRALLIIVLLACDAGLMIESYRIGKTTADHWYAAHPTIICDRVAAETILCPQGRVCR